MPIPDETKASTHPLETIKSSRVEAEKPSTSEVYDREATALAAKYEAQRFEDIHTDVMDLLPDSPGLVLDLGAGSGRDAAWFADQGYEVVAVEPADGMREQAKARHPNSRIHWLDDSLPALRQVQRTSQAFDLIWLSAIWMHVPPPSRQRAFRKLVALLSPGGRMMLSLRKGPIPPNREMYATSVDEIEHLARRHGLIVVRTTQSHDRLGRSEVSWQTVWIQAPDDGLGALPLFRHIIINDAKSSTYKVALLRVLVRIADSVTGLAEDLDDDTVGIPLGLVALYWIRAFKPLIEQGVRQLPRNARDNGPGFVRDGFIALRSVSPHSLRLGARFSAAEAVHLLAALRDARRTIVNMPAHFITYPGTDEPVFTVESFRVGTRSAFALDGTFLGSFGRLRIPRSLWLAMSRYATWIEPALISTWIDLMRNYEGNAARTYDQYHSLLRWLDPQHDTQLVRDVATNLRTRNRQLKCIWSNRPLSTNFDIDHCFPFSAWPCNDLWNLFPAHPEVNRKKGGRLPDTESLWKARDRIMTWWGDAFLANEDLKERFATEATAALPAVLDNLSAPSVEAFFDALLLQRASLKSNQQLAEWKCC